MFHTTPHQKYDHNSEICQKSPDHNSAIRPDDISAVNTLTHRPPTTQHACPSPGRHVLSQKNCRTTFAWGLIESSGHASENPSHRSSNHSHHKIGPKMFHTTPHQKYDHNSEICQKSPDHNSAIRPDDISAGNNLVYQIMEISMRCVWED